MRFLPVNLTTALVELAGLDETIALFASLSRDPVDGVEEMVPAARTIMIRYRPERLTLETLAEKLRSRDVSVRDAGSGRLLEIPVRYDGEDIGEVARLTGLTADEVVRRHTQSEYIVAFCGFAPGFAYLAGGDPGLHVPRRRTPRTRIPAGAVALAGEFSGVYPQASPGGWQIIGTTPLKMWDLSRDPPALLQPGCRVRFYDLAKRPVPVKTGTGSGNAAGPAAAKATDKIAARLTVRSAPVPALFQDLGRFGRTGQGVSASGALDQGALCAANRIVGNPAGWACLEIALGGFSFEVSGRAVMALTGASCPVTIQDRYGNRLAAQEYRPVSLEPGDIVTLGQQTAGMRSYLAVRGGFAVEPVLGSASTDTLAHIGPQVVTAGAVLGIRSSMAGLSSMASDECPPLQLPAAGDIATLDIVLGPRTDWFTAAGLERLTQQLWRVTPQSSRVGIRLAGEKPLERAHDAELPSEGTATGAIQVPHDGQPVLFLADHPLTGGYPVIGAVAEYHLDLAGQLPINGRIRFRPIRPFFEI